MTLQNRLRAAYAVWVIALAASIASAGVIETGAYRVISAKSEAGPFGDTTVDDPPDIEDWSFPPPDTTFNHLLMTSAEGSDGLTFATGDASQNTTLANAHYFGSLTTAASAANNGGDWADGYGDSDLTVFFDLDTTMDIHFVGSYDLSEVESGSSAMVQALLLGDATEIIVQEVNTGSGGHDFFLQLGPGSYSIDISVSSSANRIFNPGTGTADATYDFEYTIIPEPSSVALLAIAGLVTLRPRRGR